MERCSPTPIGPPTPRLSGGNAQVGPEPDRYDGNLSVSGRGPAGGTRGDQMELSDRERKLAVLALLVIVLAAGVGTLGAVFSGFSFI